MTQVSKYPLRKEIQERVFEVFLDSIAMVKKKEEVDKLVTDLLSPTERTMLAKRLSIALLLMKGYDQRAICNILKVSLGTVSRVSLAMQKGTGGYAMVVGAITGREEFRAFLRKLEEGLAEVFIAGRPRPGWRRAQWETNLRNRKAF